jgi:hypothetical protein
MGYYEQTPQWWLLFISPNAAARMRRVDWSNEFMTARYRSQMGSITFEQLPAAVKMSVTKDIRYAVREVTTKQDLDDIMDVIWEANYTPYEPFMQLFFPVLGYTQAHREAAIVESKTRFWSQHQADPSSHWYYAVDTVTGEKVGCAQWVISESNPFTTGVPKLKTPWWPEGVCRDFSESIVNQVYKPRASWMTRPHCGEWSLGTLDYFRSLNNDDRRGGSTVERISSIFTTELTL